MTADAGIVRDAASLARAIRKVTEVPEVEAVAPRVPLPQEAELRNLSDLSRAVLAAASAREESRGAHSRSDFPESSEALRVRFGFESDGEAHLAVRPELRMSHA
jgi:aspartate oxidase